MLSGLTRTALSLSASVFAFLETYVGLKFNAVSSAFSVSKLIGHWMKSNELNHT